MGNGMDREEKLRERAQRGWKKEGDKRKRE